MEGWGEWGQGGIFQICGRKKLATCRVDRHKTHPAFLTLWLPFIRPTEYGQEIVACVGSGGLRTRLALPFAVAVTDQSMKPLPCGQTASELH